MTKKEYKKHQTQQVHQTISNKKKFLAEQEYQTRGRRRTPECGSWHACCFSHNLHFILFKWSFVFYIIALYLK